MIKNMRSIVLWCLCLFCGCSEVISYDRNAAMKEETLCAIMNAGYKYDKGVHYLDNEAVRCSFFVCEGATSKNRIVDMITKHGWIENVEYLDRHEWEYAFVKYGRLLLLRMDEEKMEVMIICTPLRSGMPSKTRLN